MPQPLFDKPKIYQDPFKKEINQFCIERNDEWSNGGCKFATLLNLNSVDDKIIVQKWMIRSPKIKWLSNEMKVQVTFSKMKGVQLPEIYSTKYLTKGIPTRGAKGDIVLACVQWLEPENEVNMRTLSKTNNFVNRKGQISIFSFVHNNMKLLLVMTNFSITDFSVLGLFQIRNKDLLNHENTDVGSDYITPGLIDKFNRRLEPVVKFEKLVKVIELKRPMCLKEFSDRYGAEIIKDPATNDEILYLNIRRG